MKIDFNNPIDFFKAVIFSNQKKNIPIHINLEQAYDQGAIIDKNNKLLSKFIDFKKDRIIKLTHNYYRICLQIL